MRVNSSNQELLLKKAISKLLKNKEYHIASPTKKELMLKKEINRLSKNLFKGGKRDDKD